MKKKILIITGLTLVALAGVWHLAVAPRLTVRIPPGWSWEADFIGTSSVPDPETGKFPDILDTALDQRRMYITAETGRPDSVNVGDTYIIKDPVTGQKTFEYMFYATIDPQTGAHLQKEFLGEYYVFPRFVEKKTYKFRNNYVKGVPLAFDGEETINNLLTYLFAYRGRGEYTESYGGTADFPGVKVDEGKEIKCDDDQFILKLWIEPVTGEIVKLEESCNSGDYLFDIATGERLEAIFRWSSETSGDDVLRRVKTFSRERARLLWVTRYIPLGLLLAGLSCLGLIPLSGRLSKNENF